MTNEQIWDFIIDNKGLMYSVIFKYIHGDVEEIFNIAAINLFYRIKSGGTNYLYTKVKYSVLDALGELNKNRQKEVYVYDNVMQAIAGGDAVCI